MSGSAAGRKTAELNPLTGSCVAGGRGLGEGVAAGAAPGLRPRQPADAPQGRTSPLLVGLPAAEGARSFCASLTGVRSVEG